jgi:hypothetical protein
MDDFIFNCQTKIIFGKTSQDFIGKECKEYGKNILLHYGSGSIKKSGLYNQVIKNIQEQGLKIYELSGVKPNPRLELVNKGIRLCRNKNIDLVLAVGGGSVIDSAKAISMGVHYKGDVWDFFEGKGILNKIVPLAVVLTLSGSGSEASKYTVITNEQNFQKIGFRSDQIRPKFAILNPELTYSVPKDHTAAGVVDIISHLLERYFGKVSHSDINDRLIEVTIKTVIENALRLIDEPSDYHVRSEIMWASTLAQNDLMGLGRISDFEMHKIEHQLSAFYDISHGAGLAIITPAWMKYVYKKNTHRFKALFSSIFNMDISEKNLEENILKGILKTESFFKKIGMPIRLRELDISEEKFDEIASRCVQAGPIGKAASLGNNDIISILNLAK